jgi:hypothetical protein
MVWRYGQLVNTRRKCIERERGRIGSRIEKQDLVTNLVHRDETLGAGRKVGIFHAALLCL